MRQFALIAAEISVKWKNINPYAKEYLDAMKTLFTTDKSAMYYYDDAKTIVLYFLANAQGWRGEDARRIKAELKAMIA